MDAQDIALFATTTAYAAILDAHKDDKRWEPDGAWIEVVLGTAMCLGAVAVRVRTGRGDQDWRAYERATWRAFAVGGAPIIAWQIGRAIWRRMQARERVLRRVYERAETMAERSQSRPRWNSGIS